MVLFKLFSLTKVYKISFYFASALDSYNYAISCHLIQNSWLNQSPSTATQPTTSDLGEKSYDALVLNQVFTLFVQKLP